MNMIIFIIRYYFDIGDAFFNNQFKGTWESYHNNIKKKCNWGDYRMPDSKGLDGGATDRNSSTAHQPGPKGAGLLRLELGRRK